MKNILTEYNIWGKGTALTRLKMIQAKNNLANFWIIDAWQSKLECLSNKNFFAESNICGQGSVPVCRNAVDAPS